MEETKSFWRGPFGQVRWSWLAVLLIAEELALWGAYLVTGLLPVIILIMIAFGLLLQILRRDAGPTKPFPPPSQLPPIWTILVVSIVVTALALGLIVGIQSIVKIEAKPLFWLIVWLVIPLTILGNLYGTQRTQVNKP